MKTEDKERIKKEAEDYAFQVPYDGTNKFVNEQKYDGYIAGAIAERNYVINEAIEIFSAREFSREDYNGRIIFEILESLKK